MGRRIREWVQGAVDGRGRGIVTHCWAAVISSESMVDEEMNIRLHDGRAVGFCSNLEECEARGFVCVVRLHEMQ